MTVTVEIPDEMAREIAAEAKALGIDMPTYAAALLKQAVRPLHAKPFSRQEFEKTLDELAQFSHKIPLLPDEAFSRGSLYRDHD